MKNSIKSALLSAAVFPGAGHLYLKCYIRGISIMIAALAALVVLIQQMLERVADVINQIEIGTVTDTQEIAELIASSPDESLNNAAIVITVCWIYGIIDSFLVGKKQDSNE